MEGLSKERWVIIRPAPPPLKVYHLWFFAVYTGRVLTTFEHFLLPIPGVLWLLLNIFADFKRGVLTVSNSSPLPPKSVPKLILDTWFYAVAGKSFCEKTTNVQFNNTTSSSIIILYKIDFNLIASQFRAFLYQNLRDTLRSFSKGQFRLCFSKLHNIINFQKNPIVPPCFLFDNCS